MRFPSVKAVANELREIKNCLDTQSAEIDVRLQVYDSGGWAIRSGDSSYDLDHRGYWGASSIVRRSNCRDIAADLIEQCREHHACSI